MANPGEGNPNESTRLAAKGEAAKCPVDHKTRELWLSQARQAQQKNDEATIDKQTSWIKTVASYIPFWASPADARRTASKGPTSPSLHGPKKNESSLLSTEREVSSIPRASFTPHGSSATATSSQTPSSPASNHEVETGADPATGNWVYPSQRMFFEAMRRKGHAVDAGGNGTAGSASVRAAARPEDMAAVVPIHNAVNERAWKLICEWEAPYVKPNSSCNGPALASFAGLSDRMTPRARILTLLGYTAPFDRHDWVVDRCGKRVDYVIDFYAGRPGSDANREGVARSGLQLPSFYLDVRPKLNSWEGFKMRLARFVGFM